MFSLFAKTWCSPIIRTVYYSRHDFLSSCVPHQVGRLRSVVQRLFYEQTKDHAEITRHSDARAKRGKTGKSPALSRNCKRWISQARKPTSAML